MVMWLSITVAFLCGLRSSIHALNYNHGSDICDRLYDPSECRLKDAKLSTMKTVEDFERCAPVLLNSTVRKYYLAASGRRISYKANMKSFKNIRIIPRVLHDVSNCDTSTTLLGHKISAPIGLSPVAAMSLADPVGEKGAARATAMEDLVMIMSSSSTQSMEDVARSVRSFVTVNGRRKPQLWMQTFIFKNRSNTLQLLKRAESSGFAAIVVTVDCPIVADNVCDEKKILQNLTYPNQFGPPDEKIIDASLTFRDLEWLKQNTVLPVVAKGILNPEDAVKAAYAGASAIFVSNHGGRQLDGDPPPIEVLSNIVETLKKCCSGVEVYCDGGIRNGFDVFKALAGGASAVFIGRPSLWGLATGGEAGVRKVLSILKKELKNTMILAGTAKISEIKPSFISQKIPVSV